jgi:1-acyl-sn-glycerol-3-phosphate acyltransferase
MDHRIFRIPLMNWFFKTSKAIAIAPAREDPKMLAAANERIDAALADGDLVCIFPEGRITYDGELSPFKQGVQKIVERVPVPVYPMALRGLWGSFFSRYGGAAFSRPVEARLRRGFRCKLELIVGEPLPPEKVTPELLMERVAALRGDER